MDRGTFPAVDGSSHVLDVMMVESFSYLEHLSTSPVHWKLWVGGMYLGRVSPCLSIQRIRNLWVGNFDELD